jgi:hypothetical protein
MSRLPPESDHYYDYLQHIEPFTVWDRFHLSELIYRVFDSRPSSMTPLKYRLVDAEVTLACGFVVILHCSGPELTRRFKANIEKADMYDLERTLEVNAAFQSLAPRPRMMMRGERYCVQYDLHADTTEGGLERTADLAERIVNVYVRAMHEWIMLKKGEAQRQVGHHLPPRGQP